MSHTFRSVSVSSRFEFAFSRRPRKTRRRLEPFQSWPGWGLTVQPREGRLGGKLKIVQNPSYKNIKNLEVIDAQGKFILHIQQENNGRCEMEGDRCTVAK